jgi:uncharacterized membrane protein
MPFCAKCGTSLNDGAGFCNNCGAPAGGATPPPTYSGPQSAPLSSNIIGALTYLGGLITGIIFLAVAPYNKDPFVRFHAFQSIFLCLAYFVFTIVGGAIFGMFFASGLGFIASLLTLSLTLVRAAFLLLWLFMMYKAYNNERFSLPIIGPLAASKAAA